MFSLVDQNKREITTFSGDVYTITHKGGLVKKPRHLKEKEQGFAMILNRRDYAAVKSFFYKFSSSEENEHQMRDNLPQIRISQLNNFY